MKGITFTISESNGKMIFDWGLKGMSNINLANVPNIFGLREYVASKIGQKKGFFGRLREKAGNAIRSLASFIAPSPSNPNIVIETPSEYQPTGQNPKASPTRSATAQNTPANANYADSTNSIPFLDFTKDDLGIAPKTTETLPKGMENNIYARPSQIASPNHLADTPMYTPAETIDFLRKPVTATA